MPFIQRVVQPVNLAQACSITSASGGTRTRFLCIPGKCQNQNCINNKPAQLQQQQRDSSLPRELNVNNNNNNNKNINNNVKDKDTNATTSILKSPTASTATTTSTNSSSSTTTVTTAIIHTNGLKDTANKDTTDHHHQQLLNGFTNSFAYNTDHEDEGCSSHIITPVSPAPVMPMKKLKQHVEFLSTVPSPTRSQQHGSSLSRPTQISSGSSSAPNSAAGTAANSRSSSHSRLRSPAAQTPQSPIGAKIVAGYEFDSISNITLSNALRQLASLVLIASDIFDDLQRELQSVGERARGVQKKIMAVEQRVSAYDPKMVTVPESDLLTFAQRKQHYESDKSHRQELFTSDTRPCSLRVLYDEAGKILPPPSTSTNTTPASLSAAGSPTMGTSGSMAFTSIDGMDPMDDTYQLAAGSDDLLCITEFGQSKRKMRRRIDAEIEIRLPAAIEDLRKWTSSEALGDVTVTPDCMHHVDTSISTSVVIGDNGVLTPALSPSVLSADAVDALYSINCNSTIDTSQIPNDINKDVPLNHRLPSPEEQCKIIALRYPAEVISVDTSGKRFQRMCLARKSTTGVFTHMPDTNNLNEDVQTVSRRSRSRKARGKRRNTIAGIDQKEIQDAANGDATTNALASATGDGNGEQQLRRSDSKSKKFGRSKSSDILKKESVALPYDKGKHGANTTLTRLNSLKQWGKNRFKFMQRNTADHNSTLFTINSSGASNDLNTSGSSAHNSSTEKAEICSASGSASGSSAKTSSTAKCGEKCATDIDDECVVQELIAQRKSECRFSHERKPSYSSSEKSMSVSSSGHLRGKLHLNSVVSANVKLRDTSSLNRQRRINGLTGNKDDQPHSSSGNWSASSESGRASIGSEITLQPKSSASNTSLNASSTFHNGSSAPPSSMLSRRRFLNTSASSSVTGSEGTCTPDLQMASEHGYPGHLDDETSSAYSCDTEGYYTSFHMDSGLRTLKEEEINMSNFQIGGMSGIPMLNNGTLTNNNQLSYGSNSQQTLMGTAENEYELFGKGSTSTTTSSAGTVCTTLMAHNGAEQSSLNNSLASCGPEVPERISSLRNSSASCSTLERSISSSTIGSTLERTGTIKRNVNASLKLTCDGNLNDSKTNLTTPESQEDEFQYISTESIKNRAALPLPSSSAADMEYSESSDLEGVERIERIKQKTALNARRIPSMCIITPSTSDDENDRQSEQKQNHDEDDDDVLNKTLTEESFEGLVDADDEDKASSSAIKAYEQKLDNNLNHLKSTNSSKTATAEKLKVVLPMMKTMPAELSVINDDKLYDMSGEYVYISADVSNNNKKSLAMPATATQQPSQQQPHYNIPKVPVSSSLGIYYSNNILKQRPAQATEYVSLNDLPKTYKKTHNNVMESLVGMQQQQQNGGSLSAEQSADSMQKTKTQQQQQQYTIANEKESANTAMYAEINEIRSEIAASVPLYTPPSSASSSPHVSPHKGARVRLNAQGKPIYDSDSLKRRKGAHTTFAPGPYVKTQQEQEENESYYKSLTQSSLTTNTPSTQAGATSESVNPAVKLLLLNKSQINPRKIANVRPIINTSSNSARQLLTSRPLPSTPQEELTAKDNMSYAGSTAAMLPPYFHPQSAGMHHHHQHQQQSAMTANNAMHSPSAKSTGSSSTGSTISASTTNSSSNTHSSGGTASISTSSSINNKDEDYQHFYKKSNDVVDSSTASLQPYYETLAQKPTGNTEPFQRNTPVYWTLQNRKPAKQPVAMNATTSRDDLYATPIKRSERQARANAVAHAQLQQQQQQQANSINGSNLSPSIQRNRVSQFMMTSTPIRGAAKDSQLPADNIPAKQPTSRMANWDDNSPERLNTCADRIGQSKTSLMDFKKLLLAKSAKTSTLPKKISAVELLKKTNQGNVTVSSSSNVSNNSTGSGSQLNSSMKLLDLSGSPKTFANRRMLRQGQFGSPSKTFAPKTKTVPAAYGRSNSVQRTDIMSTTIMEANSEEDHTNSSGSRNSSRNSSLGKADLLEKSNANTAVSSSQPLAENLINTESFNYKRNIFLQSEENNFMRNELRNSFNRSTTPAAAVAGSLTTSAAAKPELNKYIPSVGTVQPIIKSLNLNDSINSMTSSTSSASSSASAAANETAAQTTTSSMPALETAL